jgi:predicted ATPase
MSQLIPIKSAKPILDGKYTRGSEWHRWDPHVHTPESALANNFGSWDEYVDALEAQGKNVSAVGITDYCTIEGYKKVLEFRKKGRLSNFDLIFPNIEFRTTPETPAGGGINIHLLINPADPSHVTEIERALSHLLYKYDGTEYGCFDADLIRIGMASDPKQKDEQAALKQGINLFKPDFSKFRDWYDSQKWLKKNSIIVIANGKDGAGGLSKDAGFLGVRQELYRFSHMIFSGNPTDRDYFLGKRSDSPEEVIRKNGSLMPCVHGSDAHDMNKLFQPDQSRYCWIKADMTFEGLRQLLHEPEDRVYIGPTPPATIDDSKVIDYVQIEGAPNWFDAKPYELNAGLVAIIGEKGSGKTALAELTAFGCYAWNEGAGSSSFIKKARQFPVGSKVRVHWRDGHETEVPLDKPLPNKPAEVRYMGQDFVEELCSFDLSGKNLIKQIEEVVFSHIPEADRLDTPSFDELKKLRTESLSAKKTAIKTQMAKLNSEIVALEDQVNSKDAKARSIARCNVDIDAIDKQLPSLKVSVDVKVDAELTRLSDLHKTKSNELAKLNREVRLIEVAQEAARTFMENVETEYAELKETLLGIKLTEAELTAFAPNFKGDRQAPFARRISELSRKAATLKGDPAKTDPKGESIADLTVRITTLQATLATDEKQRERLVALQQQRAKLVSEKERLEKEIVNLDGSVSDSLEKKRAQRLKVYLSYFDILSSEEATLKTLYLPLEEVIAEDPGGAKAGFELNVLQRVKSEEWIDEGKGLFDGRKKTSVPIFNKDQIKALEGGLFQRWKDRDVKGISKHLTALLTDLAKTPAELDTLLSSHANREKVYNWLFNTDHIHLEYNLRFDGTDLQVLSPGTRGIVLLVLYISMDTYDSRPLIIDQPEGNLDNASVYKSLVPFLKKAKFKRQIILVTHNPNLVVTTDADQVIVAQAIRSPGSKHPKLTYAAGSLEDAGTEKAIRAQAVNLLEGGVEPFTQRGHRYDLT